MLKIKNEVDLKELEKFGIKQYGQHYNAITKFSIPYLSILNECGRKIVCYANEDLDVLFDLKLKVYDTTLCRMLFCRKPTKENYIKACDLCVKLFEGEEV